MPDGIAIDAGAGHIYWTNMGSSPDVNDGSIERADFSNRSDIEVFFDHSTYLTRGCPELRCREAIAITAHAARRPARAHILCCSIRPLWKICRDLLAFTHAFAPRRVAVKKSQDSRRMRDRDLHKDRSLG
jgi:hypothetical protein